MGAVSLLHAVCSQCFDVERWCVRLLWKVSHDSTMPCDCFHHEGSCALACGAVECRILEETRERDEIENTKLQMNRRRQQGTTKMWKGKGGVDLEMVKLEAKVHRRTSRNSKKLQVKEILGQALQE
jgi:hypothetical protein